MIACLALSTTSAKAEDLALERYEKAGDVVLTSIAGFAVSNTYYFGSQVLAEKDRDALKDILSMMHRDGVPTAEIVKESRALSEVERRIRDSARRRGIAKVVFGVPFVGGLGYGIHYEYQRYVNNKSIKKAAEQYEPLTPAVVTSDVAGAAAAR